MITNPDPELRRQVGDVAILCGDAAQVEQAIGLLDPTMIQADTLGAG